MLANPCINQRMDGLAYTVGVIAAFVALATVLIVLRAGGERIGWAFQFQQPWFLAFIVYVFFMMALSLSGVFEIGAGLMGAGGSLAQKKGYKGSFFTGVLATTVATPCTAPFMGPALGFALTQSLGGCDDGIRILRSRHGTTNSCTFLYAVPDEVHAETRRMDGNVQAVHGIPSVSLSPVLSLGAG